MEIVINQLIRIKNQLLSSQATITTTRTAIPDLYF